MGSHRLSRIGDPVLRAQIAAALRAARVVGTVVDNQYNSLQIQRLRRWLRALACSAAWEDFLYENIRANRVPLRGSPTEQHATLSAKGVYPPGGRETLMVRCISCDRFVPPRPAAVYGWFCHKCIAPPEDAAPEPARVYRRRQCGYETRKCEGCRKTLYARDMRLLPICPDCNDNWMSNKQIIFAQSSIGFTCVVPTKEATAYLASGILRKRGRSNRVMHRALDPRVLGGRIDADGILEDPYLGRADRKELVVA